MLIGIIWLSMMVNIDRFIDYHSNDFFGKISLGRRSTTVACLVLIILFVLMSGIVASAVRAGIMAAIALFARENGPAL